MDRHEASIEDTRLMDKISPAIWTIALLAGFAACSSPPSAPVASPFAQATSPAAPCTLPPLPLAQPASADQAASPRDKDLCKGHAGGYVVRWHVLFPHKGSQRQLDVSHPGVRFKVQGWSCRVDLRGSKTGYVPGNAGWQRVPIDAADVGCLDAEGLNNISTDFGCNNAASSYKSQPQFNHRKEDLELLGGLKIYVVCRTIRCGGKDEQQDRSDPPSPGFKAKENPKGGGTPR